MIFVKYQLLLSATSAMWSMPVVLTETENENDSANQNDVAKRRCKNDVAGSSNVVAMADTCCTSCKHLIYLFT